MSALSDAAAAMAAAGIPVFPCRPGRKTPLTVHGLHDATTDAATVARWWEATPDANIAMPTGAATADVLDVDNHGPSGNGFAALRRIGDAGLIGGAHRLVRTPRGGLHLYFRPSGCRNGRLPLSHLDVRGDGGYVLVPPSVVDGVPYVLMEDRPDADGVLRWERIKAHLTPPPARGDFAQPGRARGVGGGRRTAADLAPWLAGAAFPGNRNSALFWACCRVAEDGAASLAELAPLIEVAMEAGLSGPEAVATARSALRQYAGASA